MIFHKTDAGQAFLTTYPKVSIHYIPTYLSWLNHVENRLARLRRDVIARSVFASTGA